MSAGLIYALIPGLNFLSSLAVAACLTPTDPILAAAVIGGKYADKHVPAHIRHLLAAEVRCSQYPYVNNMLKVLSSFFSGKQSGCNDGAGKVSVISIHEQYTKTLPAFPFLYIALYLIIDRDTGDAIQDWFLILWLCGFSNICTLLFSN